MKKEIIFILFSTMLILYSCTKDKPPIPNPVAPIQCWEKFIGDYIVYDTASGTSWSMTIEHIMDTNSGGYPDDFLNVINFNNEFNFTTQFVCQFPNTSLSLGIQYPAFTHLNKRYNLTIFGDDTATPIIENNLLRDTIVFYFQKENTLYWMSDAVSYENAWHKHIAVKQH